MRKGIISLLLALSPLQAATVFNITEVYFGLSDADGTVDWIEITNTGDMPGSTLGLSYNNDLSFGNSSAPLPDILVSPGDSVVFLIDNRDEPVGEAVARSSFESVWGTGVNLGYLPFPAANPSTFSDLLRLLDGDGNIVESVAYGSPFGNPSDGSDMSFRNFNAAGTGDTFSTVQFSNDGTASATTSITPGAYESNSFVNFELSDGDNLINLIGSPGFAIPEPNSTILALLGLSLALRRRRAAS
ncbi:PEP-CTERM sorting domain-containing protein [Haloferula sp.]|uniref:PEP-CTERM sorting domain-containing protein n=1 Tax=Haloferula sp. TaxID=2497595 RepID=UPI003C73792A